MNGLPCSSSSGGPLAAVHRHDARRPEVLISERVKPSIIEGYSPPARRSLDRRGPLLDLGFQERAEIGGRHSVVGGDLRAEAGQALLHRRRLHRFDSGGIQLLDDRLGRGLRRKQRVPRIGLEPLRAFLCGGRQVRKRRRTLLVEDRERLHGAAVDLRLRGGDDLAQEVDAPALQVLHRRAGAAIGHMRDVGAEHVVQQHAAKMRGRAGAGRAELHLALVLLGVGDELLEAVDRQVLAHRQDDRHLGEQRHRRELLDRIVERLLVERLALGMRADRAEHDLVAVGRRGRDALRAGHAACAADVLDHDLLAQDLAHARRHDTAEHVGRAAGRERNDHRDRTGRVVLRSHHAGQREQGRNRGHQSLLHPVLLGVGPALSGRRVRSSGRCRHQCRIV